MEFMEFFNYLARWGHIVFGIAWIGLLYYFNFIQGAFMASASNETKVEAFTLLVPKALWWFRWAAALTFLTGLYLLYVVMKQGTLTEDTLVAGLLATFMAANVWFIIWPNQKIVIASNEAVKSGGEADPNQASAAAAALLASRTNTLFSLPMVFTMVSSAHYVHGGDVATSGAWASAWGLYVVAAIAILLELNAIFGKMNPAIESVKAVIGSSVVLTAIVWLVLMYV